MTENPTGHDAIDSLSNETRTFAPPAAFAAAARISDGSLEAEASADHEAFWARQARELLHWQQPFDTVLDWDLPNARWFEGGRLNVAENCLDRHVRDGLGERVAIHWEGEPGDTRTITYAELLEEVGRFANVLRSLGVGRGDRVNIYLPMTPEAAVAMLACARIGAVHSVVFGGFSAQSLIDRINDAEAKMLITADGGYRRGEVFPLKPAADEALGSTPSIEHVVVVRRGGNEVEMVEGRDHWYHELMEGAS
ncbi:MAG: acetyl-coenzyme A synthetase, partial [Acidimicrobiia bacterium]|nr:acetyl-coenzyme A synthetase [Acidimicrobiia bacterium]